MPLLKSDGTPDRNPDGTPRFLRLWGVYKDDYTGRNGRRAKSFDEDMAIAKMMDRQLERSMEDIFDGYASSPGSFYVASISLYLKRRYVGSRSTPYLAGLLYDSALFHLWGFAKNPKPPFNLYKPGDVKLPKLFDEVALLRSKLKFEIPFENFEVMDYTFQDRE
jgi:hypothetical protein